MCTPHRKALILTSPKSTPQPKKSDLTKEYGAIARIQMEYSHAGHASQSTRGCGFTIHMLADESMRIHTRVRERSTLIAEAFVYVGGSFNGDALRMILIKLNKNNLTGIAVNVSLAT